MSMIEENWKLLTSLLPAGWRQMAWETGAVRRLRGFSSPDALLRTLMLHVAQGYSLRETVVRAKLAKWVDISDVALLKRLRNGEEWLRSLCIELFRQNAVARLEDVATVPIRIVDGTIVREPGKTGSQWRILYSLRLPSLICDFFDVTAVIGQGTGESLNRLPVVPHQLILADAGYCSIAGIEHVRQQGADVLLRVNPHSFVPFSPQGSRISLLSHLRTLSRVGQCGEWRVILRGQDSSFEGRLCALRKNDSAVEEARRRLHRRASKKQMITRPETVELAKYVLLFTTKFSGSTAQVLEFYRMRWQIELVFKRLKSLVQVGHVPKHDDCSSRPWVYGKLLIALLTQKLIRIGHDISPAALDSRPQRPPSPWREFSFALRNIQQAIEPDVSLDRVLLSWNEIARALAEESRRRVLQAQIVNQAIVQMSHGSSDSRFVISSKPTSGPRRELASDHNEKTIFDSSRVWIVSSD